MQAAGRSRKSRLYLCLALIISNVLLREGAQNAHTCHRVAWSLITDHFKSGIRTHTRALGSWKLWKTSQNSDQNSCFVKLHVPWANRDKARPGSQ
jgi:hypothetical protein